jgi:hypothetical protein
VRVLLDENLPRKLKQYFGTGVSVATVQEQGWAGARNGELLGMAQHDFDVFLTSDRGIPHQQHLSSLGIAVVLVEARSNRLHDILPLLPELNALIAGAKPGALYRVTA